MHDTGPLHDRMLLLHLILDFRFARHMSRPPCVPLRLISFASLRGCLMCLPLCLVVREHPYAGVLCSCRCALLCAQGNTQVGCGICKGRLEDASSSRMCVHVSTASCVSRGACM